MNNRKHASLRSLEVDSLLNEYAQVTQKKYDQLYGLVNFILIHNSIFIGRELLSNVIKTFLDEPMIKDFSGINCGISKAYEELKEDLAAYELKYTQEYCPELIGTKDSFITCLKKESAPLDNANLIPFTGKMAWYIPNAETKLYFENEYKDFLEKLIEITERDRIVDLYKNARIDMIDYGLSREIRCQLNKKHIKGWIRDSENLLVKPRFIKNFQMEEEFIKKHKEFFTPIAYILEYFCFGLSGVLYKNILMDRYIHPKFNKLKDNKIEKWMSRSQSLVSNKKMFNDLQLETEQQKFEEKWIDRANFLANSINAFYSAWIVWSMINVIIDQFINTADEKANSSPNNNLSVYDFIVFVFASFTLLNFIRHQANEARLNRAVNKNTTALAKATEIISDSKNLRVYKNNQAANSLFFLPIKDYKRVPVQRVEEIVTYNLEQQGQKIIASNVNDINEKDKKIAIKILSPIDVNSMKQDIDHSLRIENQSQKLLDQLRKLCAACGLQGAHIGKISVEENQIARRIRFQFLQEKNAIEWKEFFETHLSLISIELRGDQLNLKVKLSKAEKFEAILVAAAKKKTEIDKKFIHEKIENTMSKWSSKGKERMDSKDYEREEIEEANRKAKQEKETFKQNKKNQEQIVLAEREKKEQQRRTLTNSAKSETKRGPSLFQSEINDGNKTTNPRLLEYSEEIRDAFNSDKEFEQFQENAKNGLLTNLVGSIHKKIPLVDFETGRAFRPTGKVKLFGLYGNTRAYTVTKQEMRDGKMTTIYEVRGVSHKSHKK